MEDYKMPYRCKFLDRLSKPYDFQGDDKSLHSECVITKKHCDNYFGTDCKVLEKRVNENYLKQEARD
jgi:hypothetical protein